MRDDKLVGTILMAAGIVLLAPIVIDGVVTLGSCVYCGITNGINKVKFNKRIKKGLKNGSIIEIDGKYYEREDIEEA